MPTARWFTHVALVRLIAMVLARILARITVVIVVVVPRTPLLVGTVALGFVMVAANPIPATLTQFAYDGALRKIIGRKANRPRAFMGFAYRDDAGA